MKTYVVRVWVPAGDGEVEECELRGLVEDVETGDCSPYCGPEELIALLHPRAAAERKGSQLL